MRWYSDIDNDDDGSGEIMVMVIEIIYCDHCCIDDGYVQKLMMLIKLCGHDSGDDDQLEEASAVKSKYYIIRRFYTCDRQCEVKGGS